MECKGEGTSQENGTSSWQVLTSDALRMNRRVLRKVIDWLYNKSLGIPRLSHQGGTVHDKPLMNYMWRGGGSSLPCFFLPCAARPKSKTPWSSMGGRPRWLVGQHRENALRGHKRLEILKYVRSCEWRGYNKIQSLAEIARCKTHNPYPLIPPKSVSFLFFFWRIVLTSFYCCIFQ